VTRPDDRGPRAGRFNLVDAAVAVVVLVLIPVAYGAYLLFRTPRPAIVSIAPAQLPEGHSQRLEIEGANLRPFLRVSFNTIAAKSFLIGSTTYAIVDVPDLKPGSYDVVLYNRMQEVARLPKALTVVPMVADVELDVTGAFRPASAAAQLKAGDTIPTANPIAEVVAIGAPAAGDLRLRAGDQIIRVPLQQRELPATLRLKCHTARTADGAVQCLVAGGPGADEPMVVAPDALLTLPLPSGPVSFQIISVRAPAVRPSPAVTPSPANR
jgi:hypothetical protein